jgi:flagellar motility protein MotE (MotC chaperone)
MALKRPEAAPAYEPELGDLKLVEQMVKKSLQVNPGMRAANMSTTAFLEDLRKKTAAAIKAEKTGAAAPSGRTAPGQKPAPAGVTDDPRQRTVAIFLQEKRQTYEQESASVRAQIKALEQKRDGLNKKTIDEIADLLMVVLASGGDATGMQKVLKQYDDLLAQLGVSANDLIRKAQQTPKR